jgi:hypothetical protein
MEEYTRKGNHHIAVFMEDFYDTGLEPSYYIRKNKEYTIEEAQYHSSWDWLMTVVEKIEELGFRVYLAKDQCQIYKQYCDFPDNFIIDADFKYDRLENAFDGISSFCEWWERKGRKQPALKKYKELQKEVDEFISDWLLEKVIFKEEKIFETEPRPGMIKKWYPVHPKGSSNRQFIEEKMRAGLIALFKLKGEK